MVIKLVIVIVGFLILLFLYTYLSYKKTADANIDITDTKYHKTELFQLFLFAIILSMLAISIVNADELNKQIKNKNCPEYIKIESYILKQE